MKKNKRVIIEVTADLIALATKADSSHCMIADAISAALPDMNFVSVDLQTIRYSDPKKGQRYIMLTPAKCQEMLLRFDQGTEIQPWSFRMPSPMQTTPMRTNAPKPDRATIPGPKTLVKDRHGEGNNSLIIRGGDAPPLAVLSNARGRRRIYGIKAARGFDPSQPDVRLDA